MTSFTQRALGLSILFLSVASGMTIARGQVFQSEGANNSVPPLPPPPASHDSSGASVPALMPPPNVPVTNFDPYANANTDPRRSAPPSNQGGSQGSGSFQPSEVEIFNAATVKHGEPRAILHTSFGDIEVKLFIGQAPRSVHNFMDLARGDREFTDTHTSKKVRRPFYTNLTFHKVVADDYILGGDPLGTGHGGPGYTLPDEINHELKFDRPGIVAMAPARDGMKYSHDTNGSQFFISLDAQPSWDGQFTIIGEIVKGLSVATKISRTPSGPTGRPIRRVFIKTIEIAEDDSGPANHHSNAPEAPAPQAPPQAPSQPPLAPPPGMVGPASVNSNLPPPPPAAH